MKGLLRCTKTAAFAQGYKEKVKRTRKMKKSLMRGNIIQIWWRQTEGHYDRKTKRTEVKDLGKDKIEISGNGKVVMHLHLQFRKRCKD